MFAPWKKRYDHLDSILKNRDITLVTKVHLVKAMVFSNSHVWIWKLRAKELKFLNSGVGEDLESPLDSKEIKSVGPKGNQSWIFIGRTDAEDETSILWPPDEKNWLIGKDPDAGKDWRQVEKGMREDEMVGWHHWLNGHEFEQTPGVGGGQGNLACCSPCGHKKLDTQKKCGHKKLSTWTNFCWFFR